MTIKEKEKFLGGCPCDVCVPYRIKILTEFAQEIKKRCMEECEKKRIKVILDEDGEVYNQAVEDCIQAIDRMGVE